MPVMDGLEAARYIRWSNKENARDIPIIAMGMLVDNAIVVSDSALVNMQRGMRKRVSIMKACSGTALPLLAATVIAILTFPWQ